MARYLVLDWDHQQLHVVAGTIQKGSLHLQQARAWNVPQSPNPAEAEQLGRLLRDTLKEAGIAPAPLLVCVGRDRVILKDIRHPPVAAAEEPALVRFQTIKELNDPPDEVIIDYVPLDVGGAGTERRALAVVLRRELLNTFQTLSHAAGLKLAGICPRPFGAAWCARVAGARETVAVLTVAEHWAEFCLVRGEQLLLARSLTATAGGPEALLGEIRRNLAVFAGQSPHEPVRALYVADGSAAGNLLKGLQDKLAIPVHALDPLMDLSAPAERRGAFAGAVGLLAALAQQGSLPINFTKPHEPRTEKNPQQRKVALVGGLVAAVLLAGLMVGYTVLSARERELQDLVQIKNNLDRQLLQTKDDERRIKVVGDWVHSGVDWLDELYDLTDRVPDINAVRIVALTGDPLTTTGADKHVARMTIKGITTDDPRAVNTLMDRLVADGFYQVDPKDVSRNTGTDRVRYGQQFLTRVAIVPRPTNKYTRLLPPAPVEPRRRPAPEPVGIDAFDPAMFEGGRP